MQRNFGHRWGLAALLLSMAGMALAFTEDEVRKQVEASRLVTGTVDFNEEGHVTAYSFKDSGELPTQMRSWLEQRVEQWHFEPVVIDGKPRRARTNMSLRLVMKPLPEDKISLRIASASFPADQGAASKPEENIRGKMLARPRFPDDLARMGVSGTVYLILRIGRDGAVVDVAAEQVNLRVAASEKEMEHLRQKLAKASVAASRKWQFIPPTAGLEATNDFWRARVPVDFFGPGEKQKKENEWSAYIPGPRAVIPWMDHDNLLPPDALASGGIYPIRKGGIELKSALD